jgi:hypothetical protein
MIEAVAIGANPVTAWETYAKTFAYGEGMGCFSYVRKTTRVMGGFWKAEVVIHDDPKALIQFFQDGLGRAVTMSSSSGAVVWDGFVNGMEMSGVYPLAVYQSLDDVYTKAFVRYRDSTDTLVRSAAATDAAQLARIGTKEYVASGGQLSSSSIADSLARQIVAKKKSPRLQVRGLKPGSALPAMGQPSLKLECDGWVHTLNWRTYNQTASSGTDIASGFVATVLAACAQFLGTLEYQFNGIGVNRQNDADRMALDIIADVAALGDIYDQPWRFGVGANRIPFYVPRATAKYIAIG